MQTADGFSLDGVPPPPGGGGSSAIGGVPVGSRLARYLGGAAGDPIRTNPPPSRPGGMHQMNVNVPSFVPQFAQLNLQDASTQQHQIQLHTTQHPPPTHPPNMHPPLPNRHPHVHVQPFQPHKPFTSVSAQVNSMVQQQQEANHLHAHSPYHPPPQPPFGLDNAGTTYFYPHDGSDPQLIENGSIDPSYSDTHIMINTLGSFSYQGPPAHIGKFRPKGTVGGNNQAQFIAPELKLELMHRQLAMDARPDAASYPDVPQQIDHLNNIVPLENLNQAHPTQTVYKAISVRDGVPYCLRRIHNFRPPNPKVLQSLEQWKKIINPNVVQLREFMPNARGFSDNSLILVYDYYPLADTLKARHFGRNGFPESIGGVKMNMGAGVVENDLWSYVIQLSSALRVIHSCGLAARCVDLAKIIIFGKHKVLLSCCGVADILAPDHQSMQQLQTEDLHSLGRVMLCLATGNISAARRDLVQQSLNYVSSHYSADIKNLISFLLNSISPARRSINDIMPMIGSRFYNQLERQQIRNDQLENELSKELENGRLFRLLAKLNTITERPEHMMNTQWAETGDRFLLKLFRDFVFHQVMESGKPWVDMAHIVQCLNKLDAGVAEKIELVSRDGDNLIIVSYGDLKRCIDASFRDLVTSSSVVPRH